MKAPISLLLCAIVLSVLPPQVESETVRPVSPPTVAPTPRPVKPAKAPASQSSPWERVKTGTANILKATLCFIAFLLFANICVGIAKGGAWTVRTGAAVISRAREKRLGHSMNP